MYPLLEERGNCYTLLHILLRKCKCVSTLYQNYLKKKIYLVACLNNNAEILCYIFGPLSQMKMAATHIHASDFTMTGENRLSQVHMQDFKIKSFR